MIFHERVLDSPAAVLFSEIKKKEWKGGRNVTQGGENSKTGLAAGSPVACEVSPARTNRTSKDDEPERLSTQSAHPGISRSGQVR